MTDEVDGFTLMVAQLAGQPLPALPEIPGRVFVAPPVTDADPLAAEWDQTPNEDDDDQS